MLFRRRDNSSPDNNEAELADGHDELLGQLDPIDLTEDTDEDVVDEGAVVEGVDRGRWADLSGSTPPRLRRVAPLESVGWYELVERDPLITSTHQAPVTVPALMRTHVPFAGFPLGIDSKTGQFHASDPFLLYALGVIQSISVAVIGDVGVAKSTLVKTHYGADQIAAGRQVVVFDRKQNQDGESEYGPLAAYVEASGKRVARIRFDRDGGARVNVMDPRIVRRGTDAAASVGQDELLRMIAQVVRPEAALTPEEEYMLVAAQAKAIDVATGEGRDPDIRDVAAAMFDPEVQYLPPALRRSGHMDARAMYEAGRSVGFALENAISGALSGLIDGPTADQHGQPIDLDADLIIVDTSSLADGSAPLTMVMAIMTTFLGSVWSLARRKAVAVVEEGYSADLPAVGNVFRTQVKRGRGVGLALVLVMHHFSDIPMDSPLSSLFREAGIVHVFRQAMGIDAEHAAEVLGATELTDLMQQLERGEHLLFEGNRSTRPPRRITNVLTDDERWMTYTDEAITGQAGPPSPLPQAPRTAAAAAGTADGPALARVGN